jgi:hypothetical protein
MIALAKSSSKMEKLYSPLLLLILITTLLLIQSSQPQPSEQLTPEIFFSNFENGTLLFGGIIKDWGESLPLFGAASDTEREAYFLENKGYVLNAAMHRERFFFIGTAYVDGLPAVLLIQIHRQEKPRLIVIYSDAPLFGVDLLAVNDTLYIAGYIYRYSPVWESDVILIKYNYVAGKIEDSAVLGSVAFDDYPKRILSDGKNIIVVGDTYAYNVSQSDILIAKLKPDLTLISNMAVGGAGRESLEDALLMDDGSLLLVGSTVGGDGTHDAFIARVSEIGGLLYLTAVTGYGSEYAISASKIKYSYIVLLYGEFEEEKTCTLLLNYTLETYWGAVPQSMLIVDSSAGATAPLKTHNTGLIIKTDNLIAELYPEEKALCIVKSCPPLNVTLLDFKKYAANLFSTLYGWRPVYSIAKTREKPKLYAMELMQPVFKVSLSTVSMSVTNQPYVRKLDLVKEATRFIRRNMPLLLFAPMIAAAMLLAYELKKRR